jgi:UDP-N-acetylmuramyl pentapeptide phosphotransferase/UDP-N-acetylglucosamine-1-phosphate transferase
MSFSAWNDFGAIALAASASACAAAVLSRVAARAGWVDGGTSERKRGVAPAPLIGGAAVLTGLLAAWCWIELRGRGTAAFVPGRALGQWVAAAFGPGATVWPFGALVTAFTLGTVDDVLEDGLRPLTKAIGQAAVGGVLALPLVVAQPASPMAWCAVVLFACLALVVLNAVNTYDNADAAASGLGIVAFAGAAPLYAAALAAFVPWNLPRRRATSAHAILGDAGSHVVGVLFLLMPAAWPALALPLLDLGRLAIVRWRAGAAPWDGDRRHLAHRLEASGLGPVQVALVLAAIAAPSAWLGALGGVALAVGVASTALLFALALRAAPAPRVAARDPRPVDARS